MVPIHSKKQKPEKDKRIKVSAKNSFRSLIGNSVESRYAKSVFGLLVCLVFFATSTTRVNAGSCDEELARLGQQVQAVRLAIDDPDSPGAMAAIRNLGTDSRYYTMVRGWLGMKLQGDQSIVAAAGPGQRPKIASRILFLQQAIRFIDLE